MVYQIIKKKNVYDLIKEEDKSVVTSLTYISALNTEAKFTLGEDYYHIKAYNAWQTRFDVFKNNRDIGDIDYNWKGQIILRLKNEDDLTKHFIVRIKNFWTSTYEIKDFLTQQIFIISPLFDWKKFDYNFQIKAGDNLHEHENMTNDIVLILMGFYSINMYMRTKAG